MNDLIVQFQNTIIDMLQNELLTEEEFNILANLSEDIRNPITLELVLKLKPESLKDRDIADCILVKEFRTAWNIISDEPFMEWKPELDKIANKLFGA